MITTTLILPSDFKSDQELIPYHYSACCCWAMLFKKSAKAALFQIRSGWNWQDCSWSKYTSIDRVGFMIWWKTVSPHHWQLCLTSLAHCIHYSSWSTVFLYFLF